VTNRGMITPIIRQMYALELLGVRRANRKMKMPYRDPWMRGVKLGVETVFRRMQRLVNIGEIDPSLIDITKVYSSVLYESFFPGSISDKG